MERFHLRVHAGTRSDSGFELSTLKSGIWLRDVGAAPADEPVFATNQRSNASHIVSSRGMTMAELARSLRQRLGVPVIDKTGVTDYFAANLEFNIPQLNGGSDPDPPNGRPALFAAPQEAGLRLESVKWNCRRSLWISLTGLQPGTDGDDPRANLSLFLPDDFVPGEDKLLSMGASRGFTGGLARLQRSLRAKRMCRFLRAFPDAGKSGILDVGGTAEIWDLTPGAAGRLFLLNMPRAAEDKEVTTAEVIYGDGCRLPFADRAFDIVFSNSVIEHVGDSEAQQRFADEIRRAGNGYWVQTPNRWFPVEMHLLTPFVHLLPRSWRAFIVRRFTVWQWIHRPSPDRKRFYVEHFISDIRLLSAADMRRFFPDAVILRERFLFLTKSLVAYRLPKD